MDCKRLPPCVHPETECMCFADSESTNPQSDQFCGYVGPDGQTVYPCHQNCCNGGLGCPGQCQGVDPKRPDGIRTTGSRPQLFSILDTGDRINFFNNVIKLLILLVTISTLSLFIRT